MKSITILLAIIIGTAFMVFGADEAKAQQDRRLLRPMRPLAPAARKPKETKRPPSQGAQARQEYTVRATEAFSFAKNQGFNCSFTQGDGTSQCAFSGNGAGWKSMIAGAPLNPIGSRCDFVLFGGRNLRQGWVFKRYTMEAQCSNGMGYSIRRRPSEGSTNMRFDIHEWEDGANRCVVYLKNVVIEGPANSDWRDAFR